MKEEVRKTAVEYGTVAAIYMFLVNAIANRIMILQDQSTMAISGILWITSLLLIALLLPSAIENPDNIKSKRKFAESSSLSFVMLFFFFILISGISALFFWGIRPSDVFLLVLALAVPVIISAIVFYFVTIWAMGDTVLENKAHQAAK
ncbi:MAG: hypothetical protein ACQESA_02885 [Patescibacteria group bacterium]